MRGQRDALNQAPRHNVGPPYRLRKPCGAVKAPPAVQFKEPPPNVQEWSGSVVFRLFFNDAVLCRKAKRRRYVKAGDGGANTGLGEGEELTLALF